MGSMSPCTDASAATEVLGSGESWSVVDGKTDRQRDREEEEML